jgi:hypothetical protein
MCCASVCLLAFLLSLAVMDALIETTYCRWVATYG